MTNIEKKIDTMIENDDVVLFMKGTPDFPQCGFSANVVGILNYLGINYQSYNVLDDIDLREGIKVYSEWPTIPQIYIKKEFIGGLWYFKGSARKWWNWGLSKRKEYQLQN